MTAGKSTSTPASTAHAERAPPIAHGGRRAGGAQQRLGRHAADVEAVAAEQLALDQRDARPSPAAPAAQTSPAVPAPSTTRW